MGCCSGDRIGSYIVGARLGAGAMGEVWIGKHEHLLVQRALKIIPDRLANSAVTRQSFMSEGRLLAALDHPHIVKVHDLLTEGDTYAIVMDFISPDDVTSLSLDVLAGRSGGRLPEEQVARIISAVCQALAYAHARSIVHRDIKPSNILIGREGIVRVSDFGLASLVGEKHLRESIAASVSDSLGSAATIMPRSIAAEDAGSEERSSSQRAASLVGTFHYMPPEVQEGGEWTRSGDLYSTGILAYVLLVGQRPVGKWKLPSQVVPGLSLAWDEFVERALAPVPAERFSAAEEMIDHVGALSGNAPKAPAHSANTSSAKLAQLHLRRITQQNLRNQFLKALERNDAEELEIVVESVVAESPELLFEVLQEQLSARVKTHHYQYSRELLSRVFAVTTGLEKEKARTREFLEELMTNAFDSMAAEFAKLVENNEFDQAERYLRLLNDVRPGSPQVKNLEQCLQQERRAADDFRGASGRFWKVISTNDLVAARQELAKMQRARPSDEENKIAEAVCEELACSIKAKKLAASLLQNVQAGNLTSAEQTLAMMRDLPPPSPLSERIYETEFKFQPLNSPFWLGVRARIAEQSAGILEMAKLHNQALQAKEQGDWKRIDELCRQMYSLTSSTYCEETVEQWNRIRYEHENSKKNRLIALVVGTVLLVTIGGGWLLVSWIRSFF